MRMPRELRELPAVYTYIGVDEEPAPAREFSLNFLPCSISQLRRKIATLFQIEVCSKANFCPLEIDVRISNSQGTPGENLADTGNPRQQEKSVSLHGVEESAWFQHDSTEAFLKPAEELEG